MRVLIPMTQSRQIAGLIAWLIFTFSATATALFVKTGGWYAQIQKPSWNPPSWIFGPVWTTLYIMMAIAAWLVWKRGGFAAQRVPLGLFLLQWILNALWTPLFFGLHNPALAFADIVALVLCLAATIVSFRKVHPPAAYLLLPYLAWVSFAAFLNFTIWRLNA